MSNLRWLGVLQALTLIVIVSLGGFLLSGRLTSHAVQSPTIGLDMVTTGNAYDATNTMTLGTTDNCLTGSSAVTHIHAAHVIINNVEDLVGWQVRLNYVGDKMRPSTVNFTPFADNTLGQNISFNNLPIDQSTFVHRDLVMASSIPAAPADGTNTPQTASFGASYNGPQDLAISPDTPAKGTPDDSSYSAPSGGVLASMTLQVIGNESGNELFMNLDDGYPNGPGSGIAFFNGNGSQDVLLASSALGDGFHGEGVPCVAKDCTTQECPIVTTPTSTSTPTATASATPTPTPTQTPCTPTPSPSSPTKTDLTKRVSVNECGEEGDGPSESSSISGDGRLVAFTSSATNLVVPDTNQAGDIFVYDQVSGQIHRVSIASNGAEANETSGGAEISEDGRVVAFGSRASNLVANDTNGFTDVFVHELSTGVTEMISVNSQGNPGNDFSGGSALSGDGRFVAFVSLASNLVAGANQNHFSDVYIHDRLTGATEKMSVDNQGNEGDDASFSPSISGDGRFVAFASFATNFGAGGNHQAAQVFLRDRVAGTTGSDRREQCRGVGRRGTRGSVGKRRWAIRLI